MSTSPVIASRVCASPPPPRVGPLRVNVAKAGIAPMVAATRAVLTAADYQRQLRVLRDEPGFVLPADTRRALAEATVGEQLIIVYALDRLADVKAGRLRSSDYFISVLGEASRLSGGNGELFVKYQGVVFSEKPTKWFEGPRVLLGAGYEAVGAPVEAAFMVVTSAHGVADGNNANIIDGESSESSVTHHFAELFRVGKHSPRWAGMFASWYIDSKTKNPGDVRSGYFAVMLGGALKKGKITPDEAVRLVEWAYTDRAPGLASPPCGQTDTGTFLNVRDYRIKNWIRAYNAAHPFTPI